MEPKRALLDLLHEAQFNLDEAYFQISGLDQAIAHNWQDQHDENMTYPEAVEYVENWSSTVEMLDTVALEFQRLQILYYQKLHYPEHEPESPESILAHGRLRVGFAIHRVQFVIDAYQGNEDKLKLLTPGKRGELTFKTIAREIGASAAAVAYWHTGFRKLPRYSSVMRKLIEFYELSDSSEAYYWITPKNGVLLPWHMIAHYRG